MTGAQQAAHMVAKMSTLVHLDLGRACFGRKESLARSEGRFEDAALLNGRVCWLEQRIESLCIDLERDFSLYGWPASAAPAEPAGAEDLMR